MTRKIQGLGLALVAIAAMSMAAASAVQASELHATTSAHSVSIFGAQTEQHKFNTDLGTINCTQALLEGTATEQGQSATQLTSQELQITGTYTGCTAFGLAATIHMNGCKYTITNKLGAHTTAETAYVDITGCTAGQRIEITTPGCTVTVPEQHNLSHLVFTDEGVAPNEAVIVDITIAGITYETHGVCPNIPHPTTLTHNGQYTGKSTFQAKQDVGTELFTHTSHQYNKLKQTGNVVGLLAT
jgi:hypothetical protein